MKKLFALCLCVVLLFSLTACDGTDYYYAKMQLMLGNDAKGYDLLLQSDDPRAAEELGKFVFVPTVHRAVISTGWDVETTYTYDDRGNLTQKLARGEDGNREPVSDAWHLYYTNGVLTSEVEQTDVGATTNIYDRQGRLLCATGPYNVQTCTYDDKGNLVSEVWRDHSGGESTYVYTYDEEGRKLTQRHIWDGEEQENHITYTYHPNGNLQCEEEYYFEGHFLSYYDEEGRFTESYRVMGEEKELLSQKRYDEAGREIYHRDTSGYEVPLITETTYNEQGLVTERKTYAEDPEDEYFSMARYTYDADGNRLTTDSTGPNNEWYKEVCTYDQQGRRLTQKTTSLRHWANETVTYDEGGYVQTYVTESDGGSENVVFERDANGNPTKYTRYRVLNGIETATEYTVTWQRMYYPDGIPEPVAEVLENLDNYLWIDPELKPNYVEE